MKTIGLIEFDEDGFPAMVYAFERQPAGHLAYEIYAIERSRRDGDLYEDIGGGGMRDGETIQVYRDYWVRDEEIPIREARSPEDGFWLRGGAGRLVESGRREGETRMSEPQWPVQLRVQFDIQRVSPNQRMHHMRRSALNKVARAAGRLAWAQAGYPQSMRPVRVSMVLRRGRSIDQANAWAAAKSALDGCFVDALTPDDSPKWVRLGEVRQESGKQWAKRPEVVFIVEQIG